jgi:hypothetical protein
VRQRTGRAWRVSAASAAQAGRRAAIAARDAAACEYDARLLFQCALRRVRRLQQRAPQLAELAAAGGPRLRVCQSGGTAAQHDSGSEASDAQPPLDR